MKKTLFTLMAIGLTASYAQLNIQSGATFVIQSGATVTVQGDVVSQSNIQGAGKLQFKGTSLQNLNMNGNTIDVVMEIDNTQNVNLTGATRLNNQLLFTNGKLQLGNFNFTVSPTSTHSGASTARYVNTNGTGVYKKELTANSSFVMPVGNSNYNPINVNVSGASGFSNAFVSTRSAGETHPAKHPRSSDFLTTYWKTERSGITGGTVALVGTYQNADLTGTEPPIRSFMRSGSSWQLGSGQDNAANTVSANMSSDVVDLYAMNRFVVVSPKVFLQGAFNTTTGLMDDRLRSTDGVQTPGNPSATNIIPLADPYRTAEYSSNFVHINNSIAESAQASVFNHLANPADHIVDWVFLELRTFTGNATAPRVQTRSALVQRDGDIVDIDGTSPVYFKDVDAGNFVLDVRHRNHLGISTNPTNALALTHSTTSAFDFTNTANTANIMGAANTNYVQIGNTPKNAMWAGNASGNGFTRYLGSNGPGTSNASDANAILSALSGSQTQVLNNLYTRGDVNLNRVTRLIGNSGPGVGNLGDGNYLLGTVLAGNQTQVRGQALPNN